MILMMLEDIWCHLNLCFAESCAAISCVVDMDLKEKPGLSHGFLFVTCDSRNASTLQPFFKSHHVTNSDGDLSKGFFAGLATSRELPERKRARGSRTCG